MRDLGDGRAERNDGTGNAITEDLGWIDEEVAVVLVEVERRACGPAIEDDDFIFGWTGRGDGDGGERPLADCRDDRGMAFR